MNSFVGSHVNSGLTQPAVSPAQQQGSNEGEAGTPGSSGANGSGSAGSREPGSSSGNNDASAANKAHQGSPEGGFSYPRPYLLRQLYDKAQALLHELQGMGANLHAVRPTRALCSTLPAPSVISAITNADRRSTELLHIAQRLGLKTTQSELSAAGSPAGMAEGGSSDGSSAAQPLNHSHPQLLPPAPGGMHSALGAAAFYPHHYQPHQQHQQQQQQQLHPQQPGAHSAGSIGHGQAGRATVHDSMVESVAATALAANGGSPAAAMLDLLQIMIKHRVKSLQDLLALLHTTLRAEVGPAAFQQHQEPSSHAGRDFAQFGAAAPTVFGAAAGPLGAEPFMQHHPSTQYSGQQHGPGLDMLPPSDLDAMDLECFPALNTSLSADMELAAAAAAELMQGQ